MIIKVSCIVCGKEEEVDTNPEFSWGELLDFKNFYECFDCSINRSENILYNYEDTSEALFNLIY